MRSAIINPPSPFWFDWKKTEMLLSYWEFLKKVDPKEVLRWKKGELDSKWARQVGNPEKHPIRVLQARKPWFACSIFFLKMLKWEWEQRPEWTGAELLPLTHVLPTYQGPLYFTWGSLRTQPSPTLYFKYMYRTEGPQQKHHHSFLSILPAPEHLAKSLENSKCSCRLTK